MDFSPHGFPAPMIQRLLSLIFATAVLLSPMVVSAQSAESASTPPGAANTVTAPAAATPAVASQGPSSDLGSSLLQLGFGFLVVMALLFGCLWLLKRLNAPQGRSGGLMKVITALPLGTRERAVLIEVGDQWLLVGMGPNYMVKLADVTPQALPPATPNSPVPDFSAWLKRALEHRKGGNPDA